MFQRYTIRFGFVNEEYLATLVARTPRIALRQAIDLLRTNGIDIDDIAYCGFTISLV